MCYFLLFKQHILKNMNFLLQLGKVIDLWCTDLKEDTWKDSLSKTGRRKKVGVLMESRTLQLSHRKCMRFGVRQTVLNSSYNIY